MTSNKRKQYDRESAADAAFHDKYWGSSPKRRRELDRQMDDYKRSGYSRSWTPKVRRSLPRGDKKVSHGFDNKREAKSYREYAKKKGFHTSGTFVNHKKGTWWNVHVKPKIKPRGNPRFGRKRR